MERKGVKRLIFVYTDLWEWVLTHLLVGVNYSVRRNGYYEDVVKRDESLPQIPEYEVKSFFFH